MHSYLTVLSLVSYLWHATSASTLTCTTSCGHVKTNCSGFANETLTCSEKSWLLYTPDMCYSDVYCPQYTKLCCYTRTPQCREEDIELVLHNTKPNKIEEHTKLISGLLIEAYNTYCKHSSKQYQKCCPSLINKNPTYSNLNLTNPHQFVRTMAVRENTNKSETSMIMRFDSNIYKHICTEDFQCPPANSSSSPELRCCLLLHWNLNSTTNATNQGIMGPYINGIESATSIFTPDSAQFTRDKNDTIIIKGLSDIKLKELTIGMWVYTTNVTTFSNVLTCYKNSTLRTRIYINGSANNSGCQIFDSADQQLDLTFPTNFQANKWHYLACSYKTGGDIIAYFDGTEANKQSKPTSQAPSLEDNCYLGGSMTSEASDFEGNVRSLSISGKALSLEDIKTLMNTQIVTKNNQNSVHTSEDINSFVTFTDFAQKLNTALKEFSIVTRVSNETFCPKLVAPTTKNSLINSQPKCNPSVWILFIIIGLWTLV